MSDWKMEIAKALDAQSVPLNQTCEQQLIAGLQEDGTQAALAFVDKLLARTKAYIDCRFGADTTQAQAAWQDIAAIVGQCALAHLPKLLVKDYGGFIGGVINCVGSKLLGSSPNAVEYTPATTNRCG